MLAVAYGDFDPDFLADRLSLAGDVGCACAAELDRINGYRAHLAELGALPAQPDGGRVCRFFVSGSCLRRDCAFRHTTERDVCSYWLVQRCSRGSECSFMHGLDSMHFARLSEWEHSAQRSASDDEYEADELQDIDQPSSAPAQPAPLVHQDPRSLATKLKRQLLASEFPTLSASTVDHYFAQNGYNYDPTVAALVSIYPGAFVAASRAIGAGTAAAPGEGAPRARLRRRHGKRARPDAWLATGGAVSTVYEATRAEAAALARQRNKCFSFATSAFITGDKAAATAWARLGREADARMRALHAQAAEEIFATRNSDDVQSESMIDLHGLHPDEAVARLMRQLRAFADAGASVAFVVTGTGHHAAAGTRDGKSKVLAAVEQALAQANLYYSDASRDRKGGMLAVTIPRSWAR